VVTFVYTFSLFQIKESRVSHHSLLIIHFVEKSLNLKQTVQYNPEAGTCQANLSGAKTTVFSSQDLEGSLCIKVEYTFLQVKTFQHLSMLFQTMLRLMHCKGNEMNTERINIQCFCDI
jgi:hypothetical protein